MITVSYPRSLVDLILLELVIQQTQLEEILKKNVLLDQTALVGLGLGPNSKKSFHGIYRILDEQRTIPLNLYDPNHLLLSRSSASHLLWVHHLHLNTTSRCGLGTISC